MGCKKENPILQQPKEFQGIKSFDDPALKKREVYIMGRFFLQTDDFPLAEQLKALADDELLDFWEEAQYLGKFLEEEFYPGGEYNVEYERIILQELQLRCCMRCLP